jgi:hypothetical protein
LDPIEKAIRAALEKGNPEDASFRQKIYRSAELALTRSLTARGGLDEQTIRTRLSHLTRVTTSIETEFSPATASISNADIRPEPKFTPQPRVQEPSRQEPNRQEPRPQVARQQEPRFVQKAEPDWSNTRQTNHDTGRGDIDVSGESYGHVGPSSRDAVDESRNKASNGLFRKLVTALVVITIVALLVMLGWTAWNSGLFGNGSDLGEGPAKVSQTEDSTSGDRQQVGVGSSADENWITIFEPKDAASVQVSDGLTAALQGSGASSHLSISNTTDQAQGEASFEIGKGVLETLRGKKIVFNVQAKTIDGTSTQMATSCSLAGMGECQRVRFRLEGQLTENLIIVQLADIEPEASGTLSIMPDIDKTGNPVEIIGIRVRIEP